MVNQGLIFRKNPLYEKCPSCETPGSLRNSRPRSMREKIIKNISWYGMYRCKKCGWRGYRTRIVLTLKSVKNGIGYLIMAAIAALIIYEILKRFV